MGPIQKKATRHVRSLYYLVQKIPSGLAAALLSGGPSRLSGIPGDCGSLLEGEFLHSGFGTLFATPPA
jgi:hypothetical protein